MTIASIAATAAGLYALAEKSLVGATVVPRDGNPGEIPGKVEAVTFGCRGEIVLHVALADGQGGLWPFGEVAIVKEPP